MYKQICTVQTHVVQGSTGFIFRKSTFLSVWYTVCRFVCREWGLIKWSRHAREPWAQYSMAPSGDNYLPQQQHPCERSWVLFLSGWNSKSRYSEPKKLHISQSPFQQLETGKPGQANSDGQRTHFSKQGHLNTGTKLCYFQIHVMTGCISTRFYCIYPTELLKDWIKHIKLLSNCLTQSECPTVVLIGH